MRRPVPAALGAAAAVAALVLAAPALRLALVGRAELARGVAAQAAGDTRAALALYERAARCAFPFSPWSREEDRFATFCPALFSAGIRAFPSAQGNRAPDQARSSGMS